MSEEPNPYAAPSSPIGSTQSSMESTEPNVTARSIFLSWEKWLRPAYNLILAGVACLIILNFTNLGYPVPRNGRTVFHFISRGHRRQRLVHRRSARRLLHLGFTRQALCPRHRDYLHARHVVLHAGRANLRNLVLVHPVPGTQIFRLTKPSWSVPDPAEVIPQLPASRRSGDRACSSAQVRSSGLRGRSRARGT